MCCEGFVDEDEVLKTAVHLLCVFLKQEGLLPGLFPVKVCQVHLHAVGHRLLWTVCSMKGWGESMRVLSVTSWARQGHALSPGTRNSL